MFIGLIFSLNYLEMQRVIMMNFGNLLVVAHSRDKRIPMAVVLDGERVETNLESILHKWKTDFGSWFISQQVIESLVLMLIV